MSDEPQASAQPANPDPMERPAVNYRPFLIPAIGLLLLIGGFLIFGNLNSNLVFYMTPTEAAESMDEFSDGRRFRLAGDVVPGTIQTLATGTAFEASDGTTIVAVRHTNDPPQLFQEGIEVVVEGAWEGNVFVSDVMLVKHDEEYRTPEEGNYSSESSADTGQ